MKKRIHAYIVLLAIVGISALFLLFMRVTSADYITVERDGTGDYTSIREAVTHASSGDTVIIGEGIYEEQVNINKSITIRGQGPESTTISSPGPAHTLHITADWVNISGLSLRGVGDITGDATVKVRNVRYFYMSNCSLANAFYGLYLQNCTNCAVKNSDINGSKAGVYVYKGCGNLVEDTHASSIYIESSFYNTLRGNVLGSEGLRIEGEALEQYFHTVKNNTVGFGGIYYLANASDENILGYTGQIFLINSSEITGAFLMASRTAVGIEIAYCNGVLLDTVVCANNTQQGIKIIKSAAVSVENSTVIDCAGGGIFTLDSERCSIVASGITWNSERGIEIAKSRNISVVNCTIQNNVLAGVYIFESSFCLLRGNNLSYSSTGCSLLRTNHSTILQNQVFSNSSALLMTASNENTIANSHICGMSFLDDSNNNTIMECNLTSLYTTALYLYVAKYNTITGCDIYGTLHLDYAEWNNVSNNRFWSGGIEITGAYRQQMFNNTYNHRPVYYYYNQTEFSVPPDAGIVFLVNCNNVTAEGLNISDVAVGMLVENSNLITIRNSTFQRTTYASLYVLESRNVLIDSAAFINNTFETLILNATENVTLIDTTFAANPVGVEIFNSKKCRVLNTYFISNFFGAFASSSTVRIENSSFDNNTEVHLSLSAIKNSTILSTVFMGGEQGIEATGTQYTYIAGNRFENVSKGAVHLENSEENTVCDNVISDSDSGIELSSCIECRVENNTISDVHWGIYLFSTLRSVVSGNVLQGGSLVLEGGALEHYIHTIANNTVNGAPVYYYKNTSGFTVPTDANAVILVNCSNALIHNIRSSRLEEAILCVLCRDLRIENCTLDRVSRPIILNNVDESMILNNTLSIGITGIELWKSEWNILANNNVSWYDTAVRLTDSTNNDLSWNSIARNVYGHEISIGKAGGMNEWRFNNFTGNHWVFRFATLRNNMVVHHNNFWKNENIIAGSPGDSAVWHYQNKGNYWDTYTGRDENGDGVGDESYEIDGYEDPYPLIAPVVLAGWQPSEVHFPAPSSILNSRVSGTTISLSWARNPDWDFSRYEVFIARRADFSDAEIGFTSYDREEHMCELTNLRPHTTYYVKVRTYDQSGNYADSETIILCTSSASSVNPTLILQSILTLFIGFWLFIYLFRRFRRKGR